MAKRSTQRQGQPQASQQPQPQQEQATEGSVATLERESEQNDRNAEGGLNTDDIARRAYEIYCERGCEHGRDMDDWLQAEHELKGR